MANYLRIARLYTRGAAAAVWLFLLLCLVGVAAGGVRSASHPGGILGGVLSTKSYLAMFAYFNACLLGALLRDNIAHPWASVLPRYRQKHLLVATLVALVFLGLPMGAILVVAHGEVAPVSVAVMFLTFVAAGLWTLHHPAMGVLAFPFLVFVMAPASSSPALADFLAGTNPAASAALVVLSAVALGAFAWRLLVMNEDALEYPVARVWGALLRGRGVQPFRNPAAVSILWTPKQTNDASLTGPFTNLRQVENLAGYRARGLWQRLQLWRLGTAPTRGSASVAGLMVLTLLVISPTVVIAPWMELPARNTVVIFAVQVMMNPFNRWLSWFQRRHRLSYESLRPRTRPEFVREIGLALLWDSIQCWLGGVLFLGIAAAIWAPELLHVKNLIVFICCTGVGQLCAYAMMAMWSLKRGMVANVSCALGAFMVVAQWMIWTMDGSIGVGVNSTIASVLTAASVATIALAYRRWCRADLD